MRTVGPFVIWSVAEQGLPMKAEVVFVPRVINAYCAQLAKKGSTRSTYRSVLMLVSKALNPAEHSSDVTPIQRREINAPYSATEMEQFRRWAKGQNTQNRRLKGMALLALAAGAGLMPAEIGAVAFDDIEVTAPGVVIRVHGKSPRSVPVLREWEKWVLKVRDARKPSELLWGTPKRTTPDRNLVSNFTKVSVGRAPNAARLRAYWITKHLSLGTPMKALFRAGGFSQLGNLDQYLQYVDTPTESDYRHLLRGGSR